MSFNGEIGLLAIAEYAAWKERNEKRKAYRAWLKWYLDATGEWYEKGGELEDDEAHYRLHAEAVAAQKKLTTARAATRRAIARIGN